MAQPPQPRQDVITNEEKTGLLFNRFNNVADTKQGRQYSFQPYLALDAIKAEGILSEAIPTSLSSNFTVNAMDLAADAAGWSVGTTYNLGTGVSSDPTKSNTLGTVAGATMLEFVYKLQLHECTAADEQAFTHPPQYAQNPGQGPSTLQNTIPFKQDAGQNDSYNYKVFAVTNSTAGPSAWVLIPKSDPGTLYVLDTKTGILQFMAPADSQNLQDPSRMISAINPPAISFHRYVGATGVGSSQSWGDASFNNVDISGQLNVYNDASMTAVTCKNLTVAYHLDTAHSVTNYRFFDNTDFSSNYADLSGNGQSVCIAHSVDQFWSSSLATSLNKYPEQSRVSSAVFDVYERSTDIATLASNSGSISSEGFLTFKVTRYNKASTTGGQPAGTYAETGGCCTVQILNYNNQNGASTSPRITKVTAEIAEIDVKAFLSPFNSATVGVEVCNILLQRQMNNNVGGTNKDYNTKIEVRCRDNMLLQKAESLAASQRAYFLLTPHRDFQPNQTFNGGQITPGGNTRVKHVIDIQDGFGKDNPYGTTFSNWGNLRSNKLTCGTGLGAGIDANSQTVSNVKDITGSNNSNHIDLSSANINIKTNNSGSIRFGLPTWITAQCAPKFDCTNANLGNLNMGPPQGQQPGFADYKNAITNVVDICGTSELPLTIQRYNSGASPDKPIVISTNSAYQNMYNSYSTDNIIIISNQGEGIDIAAGLSSTTLQTGVAESDEVLIRSGASPSNQAAHKYSFRNTVFDVYGNNIAGVDNLDVSSINQSPATTTLSIGNGSSRTEMKGAFNMPTDASANLTSALSQTGDIAFDTTNNVIKYHDNSGVVAITPSRYYGAAVCDSYPTTQTTIGGPSPASVNCRYFDATLQSLGNVTGTNINQMYYMVPQKSRLLGCHVQLGYVEVRYIKASTQPSHVAPITLRMNHAVLSRTNYGGTPQMFSPAAVVPIDITGYSTSYILGPGNNNPPDVLVKNTEVIFPTPYVVDGGAELELRAGSQQGVGYSPQWEIFSGAANVSGGTTAQKLANITIEFSTVTNNTTLGDWGYARYILETI